MPEHGERQVAQALRGISGQGHPGDQPPHPTSRSPEFVPMIFMRRCHLCFCPTPTCTPPPNPREGTAMNQERIPDSEQGELLPEWKKHAFGAHPTFGKVSRLPALTIKANVLFPPRASVR